MSMSSRARSALKIHPAVAAQMAHERPRGEDGAPSSSKFGRRKRKETHKGFDEKALKTITIDFIRDIRRLRSD